MSKGNTLEKVRERYSDRFFDVGICESHAVAFAAGMAKAGMRPVVDIYSTFLQRSFDQIFQEVCLQNLPVVFCMDRAGLTGPDGPTHHGVFDITYMRLFPNMVSMAPGDEEGTLEGGFGSAVLEAANAAGLDTRNVVRCGVPDRFVEHGERGELLADLGLSPDALANTVRQHRPAVAVK